MGLMDKIKEPSISDKQKLVKQLALNTQDVEFILLAIKNSMIAGSHLDQAVSTVTKLQKLYTKLEELNNNKK